MEIRSARISPEVTLECAIQDPGATRVPALVCLHGVTDSCRSYEGVLPFLSGHPIRVIAVSLRGHGNSSQPAGGYRFRNMAEDVRLLLDALDLPSAILVGHSMGASVAMQFAASHPDRAAGLVLMGAFASYHDKPDLAAYVSSVIDSLADPVPRAIVEEFQVSTLARSIPPKFLDTAIQESQRLPAWLWRELFHGFLEDRGCLAELAKTRIPALLLWGDQDCYAPRQDQERLLASLPEGTLCVHAGAGHSLHWENPAQVAHQLWEFASQFEVTRETAVKFEARA